MRPSHLIVLAIEEEFRHFLDVMREFGEVPDGVEQRIIDGERSLRLPITYQKQVRSTAGFTDVVSAPVYVEFALINDMGNVASAAAVSSAIAEHEVLTAILVGIAGSLAPDEVKLGDVVIGADSKYFPCDKVGTYKSSEFDVVDDTFEFEGSVSERKLLHKGDIINGDIYLRWRRQRVALEKNYDLFDSYKNNAGSDRFDLDYSVHFGGIFSADWVVTSDKYVEFLISKNSSSKYDFYKMNKPDEFKHRCSWEDENHVRPLRTVDMESFGFFKAVEQFRKLRKVPAYAYSVRGVSDLCLNKEALEAGGEQQFRIKAAQNALREALSMICHFEESFSKQSISL